MSELNLYKVFLFSQIIGESNLNISITINYLKGNQSLITEESMLNTILQNNNLDYAWIYNKSLINLSFIFKKIDQSSVSMNYILNKYPDLMNKILKVEKVQCSETLVFLEKYYFGDSFYLGEWKRIPSLTRHGRGLYYWENNNTYYVGQFEEDKFFGEGTFFYPNGDELHVTFKNGLIEGKGKWTNKEK